MACGVENLPSLFRHLRDMIIHLLGAEHLLKVECAQHLLVGERLYFHCFLLYAEVTLLAVGRWRWACRRAARVGRSLRSCRRPGSRSGMSGSRAWIQSGLAR